MTITGSKIVVISYHLEMKTAKVQSQKEEEETKQNIVMCGDQINRHPLL